MDEELCYQYWQARNIVMKMCQARKYKAEWKSLQHNSLIEFSALLEQDLSSANEEVFMPSIGFECKNLLKNNTVSILFFKPDSTGKESIMNLLNYCYDKQIVQVILLVPYALSHQAMEVIENQDMKEFEASLMKNSSKKKKKSSTPSTPTSTNSTPQKESSNTKRSIIRIEVFTLGSMQYDWTNNNLQPLVYEMSPEETKAYYEKYKYKPSQLSGLLMDNALRKWYDFEKGQLIRLTPQNQLNHPDYVVVGNEK